MFKVLYAPFQGVTFWRFSPIEGTPAVLAYVRSSHAITLISVQEKKKEIEIPCSESAAEILNCSPSLEFTKLTLRSIRDQIEKDISPKDSKLLRSLRYESMFRTRDRQPPFAPNNGERVDGYW